MERVLFVMKKQCKSCKEILDVSCFTKSKLVKDGYENKCKTCRQNARKSHKKECEICDKVFLTTRKTRFCSVECQGIARRNRVEKNCSYCQSNIEVQANKSVKHEHYYRNQGCRTEHLKLLMAGQSNHNYKKVVINCSGCCKEIATVPSKVEHQKYIFCSYYCYKNNIGKFFSGEDNTNYRREIAFCFYCDKVFQKKPSELTRGERHFCSSRCYKKQMGLDAKERTLDRIIKTCPNCSKEILVLPSQIKGKQHVYCSRECKNKYIGVLYFGENHPSYNPNLSMEERIIKRKYPEYREWRNKVYERDNYKCCKCGDNNGGNLVAHHIENYSEHKNKRTDVNNGITLCKECHVTFHNHYGYTINNRNQLKDFLK